MTLPAVRRLMLCVAVLLPAIACNREAAQEETRTAEPTAEMSDSAVHTSVQARLYADDDIRGEDIDVETENGTVTLRGSVSSPAVKQQAVSAASGVAGVTRVDDQLTVQAAAQPGTPETADTPYRSAATNRPGWITTKIQAQYFVNPGIRPWNVDVTTSSGGVVELRGEVEDAEAKAEAVRIAEATEGVTRVEDHLRVQGGTPDTRDADAIAEDVSDVWLTAKVQAKYFLDDDVKGLDIDVTTMNRVVTLSGTVDDETERRQAIALARNTDGVREVRDQLRIDPPQPRADEARGTTGEVAPELQDPWITTKIQAKYFLDADVKGHRIDVDTRRGVVTLTGTVGTADRKNLAERIARETDGVTRVVNRLRVAAEG